MIWLTELSQHIERASPGELPALIGELEQAKAKAWARLAQPASLAAAESNVDYRSESRMVDIGEAAKRLGMSESWLYRNAALLPFSTRPNGRNWRFDTRGIDKYLRDRRPNA
jgi:predicted DNA-binding transcriptional regulator AlpA